MVLVKSLSANTDRNRLYGYVNINLGDFMAPLSRAFWARYSRQIHLTFSWFGGIALLIWGLSSFTHVIMSWTGPQQAKFFPPRLMADLPNLQPPGVILRRAGITQALQVRVAASFDGPILQVTEGRETPRRYFSMQDGRELQNRDHEQALWLARYYTGLEKAEITSVTFQSAFDDDYPWVNRLLPVWRVEFATPDRRRAYLSTEINALAAQHTQSRYIYQAIFQALHSWTWIDRFPFAQIVLMGGLILALIGMAITGIAMLLTFKRRLIHEAKRRWHRRIAYLIWLPIFAFSASGFWHLIQKRLGDPEHGQKEAHVMDLSAALKAPDHIWFHAAGSGPANALSFVQGPDGVMIRVERPAPDAETSGMNSPAGGGEHAHHGEVSREERFKGKSDKGGIVYFDALTGSRRVSYDTVMARHLAVTLGGASPSQISSVELLSQFSNGYDFRNKRLPVWQVSLDDAEQRSLFIDTGANLLVDQATRAERWENTSFSLLHKWTFLRPLVGRVAQDALIVSSVMLGIIASLFGFAMALRQRRKRKVSV
jgi:hypothetical protein